MSIEQNKQIARRFLKEAFGEGKIALLDELLSSTYVDHDAPPGTPPGSRVFACQNISMAQFAERLQGMAPELSWPVADATGLEGGWDFTLTFSMRPMMAMGMSPARSGGDAGPAAAGLPSASEPVDGYTLFEALEKQLGLKLEKQKRTAPVIVIDHIEPKPTEN